MQNVDVIVAPIVFDINAEMTSEQVIKEMHTKTASSVHPSKLIMQTFIMIVMTYETVCSTARAAAAAVGHAYVPHTLVEYESLIDRDAHATYIVASALGPMAAPDPFVMTLAEAHDDLTFALDVFIGGKNWNMVYTAGGAAAIDLAMQSQQERVNRGVSAMLKECNFLLTTVVCNSFNTPTMTTYQHLANLDFVCDANNPATTFGRIPVTDIRFPHLQLFCRLTHEFSRVGRLRGSSGDNHFPLFNAPSLGCIKLFLSPSGSRPTRRRLIRTSPTFGTTAFLPPTMSLILWKPLLVWPLFTRLARTRTPLPHLKRKWLPDFKLFVLIKTRTRRR